MQAIEPGTTSSHPGPVLDEFEKRGLTLKIKRIKCFPFALRRRRNLKIQQSLVNLESFSKKYDRRYDMIIVAQSFSKRSVFKLFSVHMKTSVFKFFRFEERFRKASFSWRISVGGRPDAVISNSFGAVCALPYSTWKKYIFSSTPRQKSGLHSKYKASCTIRQETFENPALFVRLGLPSKLIRPENRAFRKRFFSSPLRECLISAGFESRANWRGSQVNWRG